MGDVLAVTVKNFLFFGLLILTQVLGDIWLSQGMKLFGEVDFALPTVVRLVGYLFTSPWIWLGVGTLIVSLLLYMSAISRHDLSYVLPIHSLTHVLNALCAWLILNESVSGLRWLATLIIAGGVFVISWSKRQEEMLHPRVQPRIQADVDLNRRMHGFLYLFPFGLYLSKIWLGVILLVCADATGDLLTAIGMKQIGRVTWMSGPKLLKLGQRIFTHPLVLSGIAGHAIAFVTFISLLSWADISLVRPASTLTYVVSLLGARFILKEQITWGRLQGIVIIGSGVALISFT